MKIKSRLNASFAILLTLATCFSSSPCLAQQFNFRIGSGGFGGTGYRYGGGVGGRIVINTKTIQEWMKSGKLKFQDSVLKNDIQRAAHYVKPEFVDDPITNTPPIGYAAARGYTEMVKLLVANGAAVERKFNGKSLVYIASFYGRFSTAEVLISLGGGTADDLSRGRSVYAENSKRDRERAAIATAGALALVAVMMQSSMSSNETDEEARQREIRMRQGSLMAIIPGW